MRIHSFLWLFCPYSNQGWISQDRVAWSGIQWQLDHRWYSHVATPPGLLLRVLQPHGKGPGARSGLCCFLYHQSLPQLTQQEICKSLQFWACNSSARSGMLHKWTKYLTGSFSASFASLELGKCPKIRTVCKNVYQMWNHQLVQLLLYVPQQASLKPRVLSKPKHESKESQNL